MRSFLAVMAVAVLGVLLTAGPVAADASNVRPVPVGVSWDGPGWGLQDFLNGNTGYPAGHGWGSSGLDAVADQSPVAIFNPGVDLYADSTILLEVSGYETTNRFGIYEYGNSANRLTVFVGADFEGNKASINFDPDVNGIVDLVRSVDMETLTVVDTKIFSGADFGFWLESPDGIFYSEDSLNNPGGGGAAMALVFDGNDATGWGMGGDFIVAFEDLDIWHGVGQGQHSDGDYNDFVAFASDIDAAPVPEASTLMLFGTGLSGLLFAARKRGLIKF